MVSSCKTISFSFWLVLFWKKKKSLACVHSVKFSSICSNISERIYHVLFQGNLEISSVFAGSGCIELKGHGVLVDLIHMFRLLTLCFLFSKKPFPVLMESAGYTEEDILLKGPKSGVSKYQHILNSLFRMPPKTNFPMCTFLKLLFKNLLYYYFCCSFWGLPSQFCVTGIPSQFFLWFVGLLVLRTS